MHLNGLNVFLAQASSSAPAAPAGGTPGQPGTPIQQIFGSGVIMIPVFLVMMYFLFFRPQQQQRKQQEKMLANLKTGDKVLTSSGIIGSVTSVKDKTVMLRSADAKMEVTKSSISSILESSDTSAS